MKTILSNGFNISQADRLAIANDLDITLEEWAMLGPKFHLTGKPVKEIKNKWFATLKAQKTSAGESISADDETIINDIKEMSEFEPFKVKGEALKEHEGSETRDEAILTSGIEVEDYEYEACISYWEDPEDYLTNLLNNKIMCCKERMVAEWTAAFIADPEIDSFPSDTDEMIEFIVLQSSYKNRVARDAEMALVV